MTEIMNRVQLLESIVRNAEKNIFLETGFNIVLNYNYESLQDELDNAVDHLVRNLCDEWGIPPEYLKAKSREEHRVAMRSIAYKAIRLFFPKYAFMRIAKKFNCDHSTVMNGIANYDAWFEHSDKLFLVYYNPVKHILNAIKVEQ